MRCQFSSLLQKIVELCIAALIGAAVWSLAVLVTTEYSTPVSGPGKIIRDLAVPVSAIVAALAFAVNRAHQQRTLRRDRESLIVDTAVGWLGKALDLADEVFEKKKREPLYHAAPSFQIDTIASLLSAVQAQRLLDISEPDLQRRLKVEMSYTGAKLLTLLRFRETADFFDFTYYRAAHEAFGHPFKFEGSVSIAVYHNNTIELMDRLGNNIADLDVTEETKKNISHLQYFIQRVRSDGATPFSHPFFGSSVPLESIETILRFAVGRHESDCELADLLEGHKTAEHWFLNGVFILLFQSKYFRTRPDAKVFNVRDESQVTEAITAGAPNPSNKCR